MVTTFAQAHRRFERIAHDVLDPRSMSRSARRARWAHHAVVAIGLGFAVAFAEVAPDPDAAPLRTALLCAFLAAFAAEAAVRRLFGGRAAPAGVALSLVDVAAVAAPGAVLLAGFDVEDAWLAAVVWPLKYVRHATGLSILMRVLRTQAGPLAAGFVLLLAVTFLAGAGAHLLERGTQPAFGTLGGALWWAVVTMTTVGYGDLAPTSAGGRVLGTATMISGLGVFALWTSILSTGFAAEIRRRDFLDTWDRVSHIPFFHRLDPVTVAEVAHLLRPLDVARGTLMTRRGEVGDCMYFIVSGAVEVDVPPRSVRLEAGNFFGEIALLTDGLRTADVRTVEASSFLVLDVADFRELAAKRRTLMQVISAEAVRRSERHAPNLPNIDRPTS